MKNKDAANKNTPINKRNVWIPSRRCAATPKIEIPPRYTAIELNQQQLDPKMKAIILPHNVFL